MCTIVLLVSGVFFAGKSKSKMAAGHRVKCVTLSFFLVLDEILTDNEMYFQDELDPSAFLLLLQASRFCRNTAVRIHAPNVGLRKRLFRAIQTPRSELTSGCREVLRKF